MVLTGIALVNKCYSDNKNYKEKLEYEKNINKFKSGKENYYARNPNAHSLGKQMTLKLILSMVLLVVEIFVVFYILSTVWNSYTGAGRILHLLLLLSFPIPYLFFMLFFGNEKTKQILSKGFFAKNQPTTSAFNFQFY
tara:strand:- start:1157 stop:1570 length:414 start_codon:yes stop_codon:yes gene_type:complete